MDLNSFLFKHTFLRGIESGPLMQRAKQGLIKASLLYNGHVLG